MASRRKQPEVIALLSMYKEDEVEEDEEMEDLGEGPRRPPEGVVSEPTDHEGNPMELDNANDLSSVGSLGSTPQDGVEAATTRTGSGWVGIVDYGHDEVAMSPEPEGTGFSQDLLIDNVDAAQPRAPGSVLPGEATAQLSEHLELSPAVGVNGVVDGSETVCAEEDVCPVSEGNIDHFGSFLPPPPKQKCPKKMQKKVKRLLKSEKKKGISFNAKVRNRKRYRNPDFLLAVRYEDIDHIGSCFSEEVFDPHGYDKSGYYDEIELDMRRERERREQELKKSPRVDYFSGGSQPGLIIPPTHPTKFSAPLAGATAMQPADLTGRNGSRSKKSKWDTIKVDPDGRNFLPSGSHDSLPTDAAHATLMSANAGAGCTGYVKGEKLKREDRVTGSWKEGRKRPFLLIGKTAVRDARGDLPEICHHGMVSGLYILNNQRSFGPKF